LQHEIVHAIREEVKRTVRRTISNQTAPSTFPVEVFNVEVFNVEVFNVEVAERDNASASKIGQVIEKEMESPRAKKKTSIEQTSLLRKRIPEPQRQEKEATKVAGVARPLAAPADCGSTVAKAQRNVGRLAATPSVA